MKLAAPMNPTVGVKLTVVGPVADTVPFTAPPGATLRTVAPAGPMNGARSMAVATTGAPELYGAPTVPFPAVGGGGLTVTVTVAGATEVPPAFVAVYWNEPVPKKPVVGVNVMVVVAVALAVPFVGEEGVTAVTGWLDEMQVAPPQAVARLTAIGVLKAVVTLVGETIGEAVTLRKAVAGNDVPPGPAFWNVNVAVPVNPASGVKVTTLPTTDVLPAAAGVGCEAVRA